MNRQDADIMIAIRSNFFYTRTVPCELWYLNRNKPEADRNKVLMLDARNIYRKVTRKIYDFSAEQEQNLLAIVWLYRGQTEKYLELVAGYCRRVLEEGESCFTARDDNGDAVEPLPGFIVALDALRKKFEGGRQKLEGGRQKFEGGRQKFEGGRQKFEGGSLKQEGIDLFDEFDVAFARFKDDVDAFRGSLATVETDLSPHDNTFKLPPSLFTLQETSRDLVKQTDLLYKLAARLIETCENEGNARDSEAWNNRDLTRARKAADEARQLAVEQLKQVRYFWRQAHWLTERFPDAELRDVPGLVKLVSIDEIAANDWSLTPGRYVGVAPEEEDEDFDFEETLREIHVELEDLNAEAVQLAARIKRNFEELGT